MNIDINPSFVLNKTCNPETYNTSNLTASKIFEYQISDEFRNPKLLEKEHII